jgi:hypothetical protein
MALRQLGLAPAASCATSSRNDWNTKLSAFEVGARSAPIGTAVFIMVWP